ncbi:mandelate racemase/muconate lactonizing enzyme family protein [Pseudonocardia endophytica]|uniref:L-alanine-DL-glutamate epimerase-like enolase superfamily enzyme n=1 Tax=Pseudonocardia endophytica TaxID=401976 RepID=A0A4R1HSU9_PSEEN|nr:mandelate racemase/muconate lactonizing enzyme family protein [Pseudonocardia endophytica]TCK24421.1 L-alanine-DL-glutamate epimerase-like enolase superfamily enzyme [Pseudonocardia endophytica]
MRIVDVIAFPTSFRLAPDEQVTLGIGTTVKRDAVIVKVVTDEGVVGWGEAHHGRAPGTVAHLVSTTVRELVVGRDPLDVVGAWDAVYRSQLASHGTGAAAAMALSGVDMALWDIRGRAAGMPLCALLGGARRPVPAYAGGVAMGHQPPGDLVAEAVPLVEQGYRALKLRVGDRPDRDLERVRAVRDAVGDDVVLLTDANTGYDLADVRAVTPELERLDVGWLEEPFPAHDHRSYAAAARLTRIPLAAGENHYTRFEFHRLVEDGVLSVLQPDLSKAGGVTEVARIAAMASAWKVPVHPHSSMTGLNMAATIHLLAAIDNAGYFEADVSRPNRFRDELVSTPWELAPDGTVTPLPGPGIGVEVDEDFLRAHPVIDGPSYVR